MALTRRRAGSCPGNAGPAGYTLRVVALIATRQRQWVEAACALQEGLALARQLGYPYAEAMLLQVSSELCARTDQPALARERGDEAMALFQRLGARADLKPVAGLVNCW